MIQDEFEEALAHLCHLLPLLLGHRPAWRLSWHQGENADADADADADGLISLTCDDVGDDWHILVHG